MQRFSIVALALLAAGVAHAQPQYRSAFADYKPYSEPQLASWREVNDRVKAAAAKKPAPEQKPAVGHEGHRR